MLHEFADRAAAGRYLAASLGGYAKKPGTLVLGLARGGVPVAAAVAAKTGLAVGALAVRKLGVPGHGETAFGALAFHGGHVFTWLNQPYVDKLLRHGYSRAELDQVQMREQSALLARAASYPQPEIPETCPAVVLVDDGLATGATMCAAIEAMRFSAPGAQIIAAAPVGSTDGCAAVAVLAHGLVCPWIPKSFNAVGLYYRDFGQTTDAEVLALLRPGRLSH